MSPNPTDVPTPPAPAPAILPDDPVTTGATVTVACKLPHGLILRVFAFEDYDEPMQNGSMRRSKQGRPIQGMDFTIRGTWTASAGQAYNKMNNAVAELLPGGYALTMGCPKNIWDRWLEQNIRSKLVQNKIVFAHSSHTTVTEESRKLRGVRSGMEPLDPANPAERMPGGVDRRLKIGILQQDGPGTTPA